jgi:galactose mutarotase-like enzyme
VPVEIETGRVAVTWDPEDGARLTSLRFDGHEVLADLTVEDTPYFWTHGCFAMAPYAGRVYGGVLHHDGEEVTLPGPGMDGHVMHGLTADRAWTRLDQTSARIDLDDRWPFGGWVEQRLLLTDDALTVTVTVHNEDRAMPAWLGFHPWFRRDLGTGEPVRITSDLGSMYEKDADGRLTGRTVAVPPGAHDDAFVAPELPVRLEWPGALTLLLSSETDGTATQDVVVFDERPEAVCVEPQTAPPQADRLGRAQHVGPTKPLSLSMRLGTA